MPILSVRRVSFAYRRHSVVEDVTLAVERGDFLGLIGPNGSGKTTLLRLALGLLRPQRGEITWFGGLRPAAAVGRGRVAYVPQTRHGVPASFPATVAEVAASGRTARRGLLRPLGAGDWRAADEALEAVGLREAREERLRELSGGQQQRVLIARALAAGPEVLLLDEPTAGVDAAAQERFYDLLGRLHGERGLTLVLVSHDVGMITRHATRLACLNRRLFYHGDIRGFLRRFDLTAAYGPVHLVAHEHGEEST